MQRLYLPPNTFKRLKTGRDLEIRMYLHSAVHIVSDGRMVNIPGYIVEIFANRRWVRTVVSQIKPLNFRLN